MNYQKSILKLLGIVVVLSSALFIKSCQSTQPGYQFLKGNAQGTTFSIKYASNNDFSSTVDSLFKAIDNSLSTYKSNSLISRLNAGDTTVVLDAHFINVFNSAQQVYHETKGYFDPTVGLLVNAYGFGPQKLSKTLEQKSIEELMTYVGLDKLKIENNRLIKGYPEIYLDFNAIAQGYSVDVIKDFFDQKQVKNFMIEVGGEVYAQGKNPKKKPWQIGIQNPETENHNNIQEIVSLNHQALATSGNYRKYKIDEHGQKFVHTINPITGKNTPSNLLSATVITDNSCALADAYATAFMAMGFEKSKALVKTLPGLKVYFIYANEDQELITFRYPN